MALRAALRPPEQGPLGALPRRKELDELGISGPQSLVDVVAQPKVQR